jgi:hypothetical protein
MFKQFERVRTTKKLPSYGRTPLSCGSEGTIVDIYKNGKEIGYHVEFTYSTGKTKALLILGKEDIEPLLERAESKSETRKVVAIRPARTAPIAGKSLAASGSTMAEGKGVGTYENAAARVAKKASTKVEPQEKKSAPKFANSNGRKGKTLP